MNWRNEVKQGFSDIVTQITSIKKFEGWNNQIGRNNTIDTFDTPAVFFQYSNIINGDSRPRTRDFTFASITNVEVTLHIVFDQYNGLEQSRAYDLANEIVKHIVGTRLDTTVNEETRALFHGVIRKLSELEDIDHAAQVDYQVVFGFTLNEAYSTENDGSMVNVTPNIEGRKV